MKVNLVNYERDFQNTGILSKYAIKMYEELLKLGVEVKIDNIPDPDADINHHINYLPYRVEQSGGVDTLMITHLTGDLGLTVNNKINGLKFALKTSHGICFSKKMMEYLSKKGLPKSKLSHIPPAHDSLKRRPIVIAILTKAYSDGRKREWMVGELARNVDKEKFAFRIMGTGWRTVVEDLASIGFNQVEYFEEFDPVIYKAILDSSDYLLYTGEEDEGAMSVVDAIQAGMKVISTMSGFHYELPIDYPFKTQKELNKIFKKLEDNAVKDWTWEVYAKKHLDLWNKLLKKK